MKKYFSILTTAAIALCFTACESDDTEGLTFVENYPIFSLDGGSSVSLPLGTEYTDKYTCTLDGVDITDQAEVAIVDMYGNDVDAVDTSSPNVYTITYSAANTKGYAWSVSRSIFVYDPSVTVSMAGSYDVDMANSYRSYNGAEMTYEKDATNRGNVTEDKGIKITQLCPGIFRISDFLAGWYDKHRGYDVNYPNYDFKLGGLMMLQADSSVVMLSSSLPYWGYSASDFEGKYDPATGKFDYVVTMEEMDFYVYLQNDDPIYAPVETCPNCGCTGCTGCTGECQK